MKEFDVVIQQVQHMVHNFVYVHARRLLVGDVFCFQTNPDEGWVKPAQTKYTYTVISIDNQGGVVIEARNTDWKGYFEISPQSTIIELEKQGGSPPVEKNAMVFVEQSQAPTCHESKFWSVNYADALKEHREVVD